MNWKMHIPASAAGALIVVQFVLIFFFKVEGVQALRIVGYTLWALTIVLGWLPIWTFRRKGGVARGKSYIRTNRLVDSGIYAAIRHPQYLSFPLLSLALILVSQHWLVVILGIPPMVIGSAAILQADKGCIEKFGDAYREYMKRVPAVNVFAGLYRLIRPKLGKRT